MAPEEITWQVAQGCKPRVAALRKELGEMMYEEQVSSLRIFLTAYFDGQPHCTGKLGSSISPVAGAPTGGKGLKVRWGLPGKGKSGALRLAIVAFCEERRVVLCELFFRVSDPSAGEFRRGLASAR